jgi:uncharacterized membrane protein
MTQVSSAQPTALNNVVLEESIEIPAPISDVYRRWSDLARFPQFMAHVEEVTPRGGNRYHWVGRIFGVKQEWDAEVTENDPQRVVAWRSLNGSYNAGTVTLTQLGERRTMVRVRFEYAPPGEKVGQALDRLTQSTRREIHQDLEHLSKLITGGPAADTQAREMWDGLSRQDEGGVGRVLAPLAVPIAISAAGGVASYFIGKRMRESKLYHAAANPIALPNTIAGWGLIGGAAASILGAATLRSRGRPTEALFVGQWAPTLLGMGLLARMLGHRGMQTNLPTSVTSWAYASGSLGSILGSALLHLRGRREDGLVVGQWAPTLLNAALFARLFNRMVSH